MRLFLDTNVLLDYICKRQPFHSDIEQVLMLHERGEVQCIVSSLSIVNCAYITRKIFSKDDVSRVVHWLCSKFIVSDINKITIEETSRINYHDFEDAVQYFSAKPFQPDMILSRDKRGFADLGIRVMTPSEFVAVSRQTNA